MDESSRIILDARSDCREAAKTLMLGSTQQVYLITQALESEYYDDQAIYDHLSKLATQNRYTDIRIITHDSRVSANRGHALIRLAQALPSFVAIRNTAIPSHKAFRESWLMVDKTAFMRIRIPSRYEGYYELDNKLECRDMLDEFHDIWEASVPDPNTRRLGI